MKTKEEFHVVCGFIASLFYMGPGGDKILCLDKKGKKKIIFVYDKKAIILGMDQKI